MKKVMNRFLVISLWCFIFTGTPASSAEVKKLDGSSLTGDIVALSAKELQLKTADKTQTIPLQEVMAIDWSVVPRPNPRVPYLRVRLTDGTQVYCLALGLKGKTVDLMLL